MTLRQMVVLWSQHAWESNIQEINRAYVDSLLKHKRQTGRRTFEVQVVATPSEAGKMRCYMRVVSLKVESQNSKSSKAF